jgi:two-component system, sensor histidine kinase
MIGAVARTFGRESNALGCSQMASPWVLFVDPSSENLPTYAAVLEQMGVDCVCTSSAQDAEPPPARESCIGIFVDGAAQQISGLERVRQLRQASGFERTPIVFVTAAYQDDAMQGDDLGLIDFLHLPLRPMLLRSKVSLLLELQRRQGSEARHRAIFEHPTTFTIVLEAVRGAAAVIEDWIFVDANTNALQSLHATRDTLIGKRLSTLPASCAQRLSERCARVLATREPHELEVRSAATDFLFCLYPFKENSIIGSAIDITARNHAEREVQRLVDAVRAEKEWLFAVLNSINEEVYFTDSHKHYTYANPAAMREFGHASLTGVLVENVISDLIVLRPDGTPRPLEEAPPLRALTGEVIRDEEQIVRNPRTGEFRHRQVSSAPVNDAAGDIIGSVSVVRDVTEMKQAEARLRTAVDQARAAEAASRAALAAELAAMKRLHDLSTTAMSTNDQQALLEEILDATIALHAADFGSVQLLDAQSNTLHVAAQRGVDPWVETHFAALEVSRGATGATKPWCHERVVIEDLAAGTATSFPVQVAQRTGCCAMQSTPLLAADGALVGVLSTHFRAPRKFSQDELRITDLYARQAGIAIQRMRADAALIAARDAADRANRTKSHFVRAASHDLRQSVQTLALFNSTLRRSALDSGGQTVLQQQGDAIDTMMHLLDALLNISKLESGAVKPEVADFPVAVLFEKLRMEFASVAANNGLELEIHMAVPQAVRSDPTWVGEILRNLLSNAIKFTPRGSITLRCSRAGSSVRLEVIDTGIGIPLEELPLIFGEFYQVGVSATVGRRGYGLGLGIVQRLATLLQARIEVESELGKGSRFSFTVPAGELDAVRDEQASEPVANRCAASSTLLLVEDDTSVRVAMENFFRLLGHRIVSAASLNQALDLIAKPPRPELLITDFHLTGRMTGSEVISCVREVLGENFPAIIMSGDTSAQVEDLGCDAHTRFVSKPVDPDSLEALIRELLASRESPASANS